MDNNLNANKYTFWELIKNTKVEIPIIQRDYAQGRKEHSDLSKHFLSAIKNSITNDNELNLDFIYGSEINGTVPITTFQPLDGQQRLTTLFLLHWYAYKKSKMEDENIKKTLLNFSYEIRISSREFCTSLVLEQLDLKNVEKISDQIKNSNWFFLSWEQDSTIRAMLKMLDDIDNEFNGIETLWDLLTGKNLISFYHLVLKDFGLSDDLYIKMNARGRLLTPFENLKAEIQAKSESNDWEKDKELHQSFSFKIDTTWTDFIWNKYKYENSVDIAHMRLITTVVMVKIALGDIKLKPLERNELIQKFEDNSFSRELINYIDKNVFNTLTEYYELYSKADIDQYDLDIEMWRHKTKGSITNEILIGGTKPLTDNASYTQKVLFFAQTEYMKNAKSFNRQKYIEWMRVVRNMVSRGDIDKHGKRPDIIRSPETFVGAINLIKELASGCEDIYEYLNNNNITSTFAKSHMQEEILKSKIIISNFQNKQLIFGLEDNELLRGHISFALECAGLKNGNVSLINFELLEKISNVFKQYFSKEEHLTDELRRAMLTIEDNGKFEFYNYWLSYWVIGESDKRKLFVQFREIEYFMFCEFNGYLKTLILQLTNKSIEAILDAFIAPEGMPNWQVRLIKEPTLLKIQCPSKYIAIPHDKSLCYLLKSQRPRDKEGNLIVN